MGSRDGPSHPGGMGGALGLGSLRRYLGAKRLVQLEQNCQIADQAAPHLLSPEEQTLIGQVRDIPRIFNVYNDRFIYGDAGFPDRMYTITMNAKELAAIASVAACTKSIALSTSPLSICRRKVTGFSRKIRMSDRKPIYISNRIGEGHWREAV